MKKKGLLVTMAGLLVFGGATGVFAQDGTGSTSTVTTTSTVEVQASTSPWPSADPSAQPTVQPTPSADPTVAPAPSASPSVQPTATVSPTPSAAPTAQPTEQPSKGKNKKQAPNGDKGLLKAFENVKDKPAGQVIANLLLTKYELKLTPEKKAELEAIVEQDVALTQAADLLVQKGSVTEAVYVQKEAIKVNLKNINSYKKLSKIYEKMGKKGVKLYVNGEEPTFRVAPFIRDGRTLVPFRAIAESLNAEVVWNDAERSVTITRDGITIKLIIGSKQAYVNNTAVQMDVPGEIVNGSTVVPARFVSENLNAEVTWEQETQSVIVVEQ